MLSMYSYYGRLFAMPTEIIFVELDFLGSCHDSIDFGMSMLGKNLFKIQQPYYILSDAAYKVFD